LREFEHKPTQLKPKKDNQMKNFHATVHSDETNEVIFEANVSANDKGEAHEKVRQHLFKTGKANLLNNLRALSEIDRRCNPDLPLIDATPIFH
jgi:hypothetical protein